MPEPHYGTRSVQCLLCGKEMIRERPIALARHTHVSNTIHCRWVCETADCGNEVIIEDDYQQ